MADRFHLKFIFCCAVARSHLRSPQLRAVLMGQQSFAIGYRIPDGTILSCPARNVAFDSFSTSAPFPVTVNACQYPYAVQYPTNRFLNLDITVSVDHVFRANADRSWNVVTRGMRPLSAANLFRPRCHFDTRVPMHANDWRNLLVRPLPSFRSMVCTVFIAILSLR